MIAQMELDKALSMMNIEWSKQDDLSDVRSMFIYTAKTVEECLDKCKKYHIDNVNYILHRWYNYQTSEICEELFEKYGAVREKKRNHRLIDIYINGVPFDVKLTAYPRALKNKSLDLNKQEDRDFLIQWFYTNQSQASRRHFANRLFIVCEDTSVYNNMKLKGNIPLLEREISKYMKYKKYYPHRLKIKTDDGEVEVCSDIIVIRGDQFDSARTNYSFS